MARNINLKYEIINLIETGKLLQIDKIKIVYEYKRTYEELSNMFVFGLRSNERTPSNQCWRFELPDSECLYDNRQVMIIKLDNVINVTDFWMVINYAESLFCIYSIVLVSDILEIPLGIKANFQEAPCGMNLQSFAINNGDIFSQQKTVYLNHTVFGTPTHYKASIYEDFRDVNWTDYITEPTFELPEAGVTTIYLQLKDAESESDILNDSIGWHGLNTHSVSEEISSFDIDSYVDEISVAQLANHHTENIGEIIEAFVADVYSEEFIDEHI